MNKKHFIEQNNNSVSAKDAIERLRRAKPNKNYLSTGQIESAVDDLRKALLILDNDSSNYKWKWLSIALTRALYLLSLNIIRHGDPVSSTPKAARKTLLKQLESGEIADAEFWDEVHLAQYGWTISYLDCLEWIKSRLHEKCSTLPCQIDPVSSEEIRAAKSLRTVYRDEFEHMKLDGHSFQVSHLPELCLLVVKLIDKVSLSDWFRMKVSQAHVREIARLLTSISHKLKVEKEKFTNSE